MRDLVYRLPCINISRIGIIIIHNPGINHHHPSGIYTGCFFLSLSGLLLSFLDFYSNQLLLLLLLLLFIILNDHPPHRVPNLQHITTGCEWSWKVHKGIIKKKRRIQSTICSIFKTFDYCCSLKSIWVPLLSPHPTPSDVCTKSPLHLCLTSQGRSPNNDVRWHNRRIKVAHNLQPSVTRQVIRHDLLLLLQLLNPQSRYSLNSNIAKQNLAFGMCLGRKLIFFLPGLIHMQNERLRKIAVRQVAMQQSTRRNDVR